MPRPPRPLTDGGCYHVIARGNNRQQLFVNDAAFLFLRDCLGSAKIRYPFKLYHYCLMPNHIHLLLQLVEAHHLPKAMQVVLQRFGRWFQRRTSYVGHVWQGRYKSLWVTKESYFLEVGRYIERNPVRAGLVTDSDAYPWSSYPYYVHGTNDALIDEDPYYDRIGKTLERQQQAYRRFVALPSRYEETLDQALFGQHDMAHLQRRTPPWYTGTRFYLQRRTPPLEIEAKGARFDGASRRE